MLNLDLIDDFEQLQREYLNSLQKIYPLANFKELRELAVISAIRVGDGLRIAEALEHVKPKNIIEIGSFFGFSSRWILDRTQNESPKLTSIDPNLIYCHFGGGRKNFNVFCAKYKHRLKTIDAFFSLGDDNNTSIPIITEPFDIFDFAFIDGNHSFNNVLHDIILATRMMPQGGLILAHDVSFVFNEVVAAVEILAQATSDIEYYVASHSPLKKSKNPFKKRKKDLGSAVGLIQVKTGSKLAELDINSLLAKKDEMLPKHLEILAKRRFPNDDLTAQLKKWDYQ